MAIMATQWIPETLWTRRQSSFTDTACVFSNGFYVGLSSTDDEDDFKSIASGFSRHELKIEHRKLANLTKEVEHKANNVRESIGQFADNYFYSEENFPWTRYDVIVGLTDTITAEASLQSIQKCLVDSNRAPIGDKNSSVALFTANMTKIKECSELLVSETQENKGEKEKKKKDKGEKRPLITGQPKGKRGQVIKKVRKMTGLCNDTVEDEDVMTNEQLIYRMKKLEKRIDAARADLARMLKALTTLREENFAAQAQCMWICSYFSLKWAIEEMVNELETE